MATTGAVSSSTHFPSLEAWAKAGSIPIMDANTDMSQGLEAPKSNLHEEAAAERTKPKALPALPSVANSAAKFDEVPEAERAKISERLEIVKDLIEKHGRAYDYRSVKLPDLKQILLDLEAKAPKIEPPTSVPADSPPSSPTFEVSPTTAMRGN